MNLDIKSFERSDESSQIYEALVHYSKILKEYGYEVDAFCDEQQKQKFFCLSHIDMERIRTCFIPYYQAVLAAKEANINLDNNYALLEYFVVQNRWHLPEGLELKIAKEDVIQIYNRDVKSIFRSLNYFRHSSYSLFDTFIHDFWHLFDRDNNVLQVLASKRGQILRGEAQQILSADVEDHVITERFSNEKKSYLVKQKCIAPVIGKSSEHNEGVIRTYQVLKEIVN